MRYSNDPYTIEMRLLIPEDNEKENIREVLSKCGWAYSDRNKTKQRASRHDNQMTSKGCVTIPYVRGNSRGHTPHIYQERYHCALQAC